MSLKLKLKVLYVYLFKTLTSHIKVEYMHLKFKDCVHNGGGIKGRQ